MLVHLKNTHELSKVALKIKIIYDRLIDEFIAYIDVRKILIFFK